MLEHIVDENWPAESDVVGVIEGNVVVEQSVAEIETQDRPTATTAQGRRRGAKTLFPFIEPAEVLRYCLLRSSGSFSVAAEVSEVFLVKDGGVCRDQFFHLQAFELKSWCIVRQARQHLLDLPNAAGGPGVIVVVVRNEQLLRQALEFLRIEG